MTTFFKRKYIKIPITSLVIVSLLLQFIPAAKPARAAFDPLKWLQQTLSRISIPEIGIQDDGSLRIGNLFCISGDKSKRETENCLFDCMKTDDDGNCVNPFSVMSLGALKSQAQLVHPKTGELLMPRLSFPPQCELRVPMPEDDLLMTEEQKLAQRQACSYFRRIQKQAAQLVYLAKRMFNSTDPFTECFFLRNCRSDCGIKLGELKFKITLLDILNLFFPTGFITVIQKVLNVAKIIVQLMQIWEQVKSLLNEGLAIVQNILTVIHQVHNFFKAFAAGGLKMSDALIYGAGAVASHYAGGKLQEIGDSQGGNVGWLLGKASEGLQAGDGLVGGAAATVVFNQDRAKQGWEGMKELLLNFAENNRKFSQAKREALDFVRHIQGDVETVRSRFKIEKEVDFLFRETERTAQLDKIVEDYSLVFEAVDAFLDEMVQVGQLKNDQTVLTVQKGGDEIGADALPFRGADLNTEGYLNTDSDPAYFNLWVPIGGYDRSAAIPEKWGDIRVSYKERLPGRHLCRFDPPRVENFADYGLLSVGFKTDQNAAINVIREVLTGLSAYYPEKLRRYLTQPHWFISDLNQRYSDYDWFRQFKQAYSQAYGLKVLLDPQYIEGVVERALGGSYEKDDVYVYKMDKLDYTKAAWREYWESLAAVIKDPSWVQNQIDRFNKMEDTHKHIIEESVKEIRSLEKIADMDDKSGMTDPEMAEGGPRAWVKSRIDEYIKARNDDLPTIDLLISDDTAALASGIETLWWQRAGLLANYHYYEQGVLADVYHNPYWKEVYWGDEIGDMPPCDEGFGRANGPEHIKSTYFDNSYDSDIMYQTWDDRIELFAKTSKGLDILSQALKWKVSPQDPLMIYTVEKAKHQLKELSEKAQQDIDNQTRAIIEAAVNETIEQLKKDTNYPYSKYGYDNYLNCCACETGKKDAQGNPLDLNISNKSACGQVQNPACCGAEFEIGCGTREGERCKNDPGSGLDAADALDNFNCDLGANKAQRCYLNYKDGSDNCPGGPTPTCEGWIGSCDDCEECRDNCYDECSTPCDEYRYQYCYECDLDGEDYCDSDRSDARDKCEKECPRDEGGDCDSEHDFRYDCPTTASKERYTSKTTCERDCKKEDCDTKSECEEHYCSDPANDDGQGGGACWWQDYYKEQWDSFEAHRDYYQDGFDKYGIYLGEVEKLECLREDFNGLLSQEGDLIKDLEEQFENLKKEFWELQETWQEPLEAKRESAVAQDYVNKIDKSIKISKKIVGESGQDGTVGEIESLAEMVERLKAILENSIDKSSLKQETKNKLKQGLIAKMDQFVQIINQEVILPLRARLGAYRADCLTENQNCPLSEAVCLKEDDVCSAEEMECPRKNGFLNRIACFEKDNDRKFKELLDFFGVLWNLESIALTLPIIEENIEGIKPEWRMEPLQIKPGLIGELEDKAKACGTAIGADPADRDQATCDEKITVFEGQLPGDSTWETFKQGVISNPYDALKGKFTEIKNRINYINNPFIIEAGFDNEPEQDRGVEKRNVFGRSGDKDRLKDYQTALEGIKKEMATLWYDLVWGKEDNGLKDSCNALAVVFDNNPASIEGDCQAQQKDAAALALLSDTVLQGQCSALDRTPPDLLEKLQEDPQFIAKQIDKLKQERECVGGKVTCDDNTEHCVACPEWFCRSAGDPYDWGVLGDLECYQDLNNNGQVDPDEPLKPGVASNAIIWDTALPQGQRQWPPDDPCGEHTYVDKYEGRQARCLVTQQTLKDLEVLQTFVNQLGDISGTTKLAELADKCFELSYQKELKQECDAFYTLRSAFNCSDRWWSFNKCEGTEDSGVKSVHNKLKPLCQVEPEIPEFQCSFIKGRPDLDFTFNNFSPYKDKMPDQFDQLSDSEQQDKSKQVTAARVARAKAKGLCSDSFNDMRTPLNEIMKVFSVLLGIKSYTGATRGAGGLVDIDFGALRNKDFKSLIGSDLKNLYSQAEQVISMIKGIPDMISSTWGEKDISKGGSIELSPPECISRPMASYTSQGVKVTGPEGGPVCPDVSDTFAQLDAKFALIRNDLQQIDLVRRDASTKLSIGKLGIEIAETYPINNKLDEYVRPLYEAGEDIKDQVQFLWALATAVNFANQSCTCGQSWCPMVGPVPFCVSGIPLTMTPLKQPYCSLVWLLRYPLGSLASKIQNQLAEQFKQP